MPPDTPETNPIMSVDGHLQFGKISPDMVVTGCAKRCLEFDVQLGKHVDNLKGTDNYWIVTTSDMFWWFSLEYSHCRLKTD